MVEFLSITLLILLAAISPGPDFFLVVKNSLQHSRKAGIFTAIGVSFSLLIHSIYCILGLALIISHSLLLFTCIKYLGASYLIYLGIKSVLAKPEERFEIGADSGRVNSAFKSFIQGLLCNLLNPKAIMFILAFFTLIIKPTMSWAVQLGYCVEIALIHFIWFSGLSLLINHQKIRASLNRIEYYVVKAMGFVLIGFGARIATLSHLV